jgi:ABC-type sugar transport system permease subunit
LDSALTIVAYLYESGFERFMMGYASAIAYLFFAMIFIVTLMNAKVIKTKVEY